MKKIIGYLLLASPLILILGFTSWVTIKEVGVMASIKMVGCVIGTAIALAATMFLGAWLTED